MENPTPFDLNEAIRRWQHDLGASPAFCADNLEELASHLRASVHKLKTAGLSEEEAFFVAARRLGGLDELSSEFGKVNDGLVWRARLLWMVAGAVAFLATINLANLAASASMVLCSRFLANGNTLGWIGGAGWNLVLAATVVLFHRVASGRCGGMSASMGLWIKRRKIAIPVMLFGTLALRASSTVCTMLLFHNLPVSIAGETRNVQTWLNEIGGLALIIVMLVMLTKTNRPRLDKQTAR